ncbi:MAG: manganese transporter [Planctomycetaceae bacterium]|nr:manganese transporter [Planctomycetaceae bacterium]
MSVRGLGVALVAVLGLAGCNGQAGPPKFDTGPVRATCTTTIVADTVKRVGGERVQVETIMGPGVDPHKYISGSGDRKKLDNAHLVFFNGLHLEGKMADLFEKNHDRWRSHAVAGTIDHAKLRKADVDGGEHDPHVWFDVQLWKSAVEVVRDALVGLDPTGADVYRANATAYLKELDDLDKEIRAKLDTVPKEKRVLVTSHDAFGYFGRAYGYDVIGLQGVSTASEVGTAQRQGLMKTLGERKIPAVFTETSVPDDGLKAVLDDVNSKYKHEVRLIGGDDALYSDALGEPNSPGATYPGMIRHNVNVIVSALSR